MKGIILKIITKWIRFIGDDWRTVSSDYRKKFKYTQTMCYLEVK